MLYPFLKLENLLGLLGLWDELQDWFLSKSRTSLRMTKYW